MEEIVKELRRRGYEIKAWGESVFFSDGNRWYSLSVDREIGGIRCGIVYGGGHVCFCYMAASTDEVDIDRLIGCRLPYEDIEILMAAPEVNPIGNSINN